MARDEKCNGCQFALHSVPMSQSSCWACKDHSAYTPEPTRPPSPDEDLFEEMYRKVHGDVEAHPENYDDMFAGYENNLEKAVALIEWQKQEIESLTIRMNTLGLAVKRLEEERGKYFLLKENGEVVPLRNGCPVDDIRRKQVKKQLGTISINPCCRCGGKATVKKIRHIECGHGSYMDFCWVECKKCGKRGAEVGFYGGDEGEHIDQAIQSWNQHTNIERN